jgi:hypothetical protein
MSFVLGVFAAQATSAGASGKERIEDRDSVEVKLDPASQYNGVTIIADAVAEHEGRCLNRRHFTLLRDGSPVEAKYPYFGLADVPFDIGNPATPGRYVVMMSRKTIVKRHSVVICKAARSRTVTVDE